jgi:hypothetical protein
MKISATTFKVLTCAIFTLALSSPASAGAIRTWVSGLGDDANPCSRTAPCKTYAGAISKTNKDGEISTLDPGGYGAVTITKSLTINGGGAGQGYGSILTVGAINGVSVNITDVNDVRKSVRLNWLDINGASMGLDGIRWLAGSELHVENTTIDGFTGDGIDVAFTALNNSFFSMKNVVIRNCGGAGIKIAANTTGTTTVVAESLNITRCQTGFDAQNGTRANIVRGVFALNTTGVNVSESGSGSVVNLDSTSISANSGVGINVGAGARARITRTTIGQNGGASLTPAAQVDSGGNNNIVGNGTNTAPAGIPFPEN